MPTKCSLVVAGLTLLATGVAAIAEHPGARSSARTEARAASPSKISAGAPASASNGVPAILIAGAHGRARPTRRQRRGAARYPTVTGQPRSESVVAGQSASFTASAAGTPAPRIRWQRSTNGGGRWTNIAGADSVTYAFTASSGENGEELRAVFSNSAGHVATREATLTVTASSAGGETSGGAGTSGGGGTAGGGGTPSGGGEASGGGGTSGEGEASGEKSGGGAPPAGSAPQITTQPVARTVGVGAPATFTAAASGSPTPSVQWEVSSDGGGSWSDVAGASSASYSFTASSAQDGDEYRAVFANAAGSATTSAATLTVAQESSNWSGYAATGGAFSAVTADWTVPSVTCPASASTYSSQWIGIDGYASDTVEQDGIEAGCSAGAPHYNAWYEMYGDEAVDGGAEVALSSSSYPVSAGDAMTASVSIAGSTWTLALTDATKSWHYSIELASPSPPPARSSAEWIVERPEIGDSLSDLADFASASFTDANATDGAASGPISAFAFQPLEMDGSTLLAAPGALDPAGDGFTDTWYASS